MQEDDIIPANDFCIHHNIELSFIHSLEEHGLIETIFVEGNIFLPVAQLGRLEKIIRLHFELDINLEGLETITHLLQRIEKMQENITRLSNHLKAYKE